MPLLVLLYYVTVVSGDANADPVIGYYSDYAGATSGAGTVFAGPGNDAQMYYHN